MAYVILAPASRHCSVLTGLLFFLMLAYSSASGQYISPFKYENGTVRNKTNDEKRREEETVKKSGEFNSPKEYNISKKAKNGMNSKGEYWIDGFCRYRPPHYGKSHYSYSSEANYMEAKYPSDTIEYYDVFGMGGNINWDQYRRTVSGDSSRSLKKLITDNLKDGIPVSIFSSLFYVSKFFEEGKLGGDYQFSRSIAISVKRISGPQKMPITIRTQYNCTNGADNTRFEFNDNGNFEIYDYCDNCKSNRNKLKSGKIKVWNEGGWNEILIAKNDVNNVSVVVNGEVILQYQQPDIPIATRYASFMLEMPADADKKGLDYHVGYLSVISYPKTY